MADNVSISQGSGTTIATDDVGGVQYQRVKPQLGADGVATDMLGGAGAVAAGVQRVTLASDDVLVAKLPAALGAGGGLKVDGSGTALTVSGTMAATQSGTWNINTITTLPALATGSNVIGAVTQSGTWNVGTVTTLSQFGGFAINLGAGATSTGTLRITQASDSPDVAALGGIADAAWSGSGSGSLIAIQKALYASSQSTTPVDVGQPATVLTFTPTLDTSAYAAGDVLFVATTLASAVRANDEQAILQSLVVIDKDDQKPAFKLYFFNAAVTFGTINVAPSISDADAAYFLGSVSVAATDYDDLGGVSVACIKNIGLLLQSVSGATNVYVAAVVSTTPTHTASGLVFRFGMVQT